MIFYVEDDTNIRELVLYTLRQQGFKAEGFEGAQGLWAALETAQPELILLDVMLPGDQDGFEILKKLRAQPQYKDTPVIMLTAKGAEYDKVTGLDAGADDYITKPFGMMEFLARVRAALRRSSQDRASDEITAGGISMDIKRHTVSVLGEPVQLTLKEFELLRCLMQSKGQVLTREQLLTQVWDYGYDGGTRTVDVHVQTLRQKLGENAQLIETVRGLGYRIAEAP